MKHAFPTHHWEHDKFVKHTGTIVGIEVSLEAYLFLLGRNAVKTPQSLMKRIVQTIFPSGKIEVNVRSAHGIIGDSGAPLEIDVYLPEYRLGFEYQVSQATSFPPSNRIKDPHHYFQSSYGTYTLAEYQERDKRKQTMAIEKGITIINVPFWWDWEINRFVKRYFFVYLIVSI